MAIKVILHEERPEGSIFRVVSLVQKKDAITEKDVTIEDENRDRFVTIEQLEILRQETNEILEAISQLGFRI